MYLYPPPKLAEYPNVAGIIPFEREKLDFGMPWHDSFMPLGPNLILAEWAILNCSAAGCQTIWIVCGEAVLKMLRERVGDWIPDLKTISRKTTDYIPIYYIPVSGNQVMRKSMAYAAYRGMKTAYTISRKLSWKTEPTHFYICFPYGIYPLQTILNHRKAIHREKSLFCAFEGTTALHGSPWSLTLEPNVLPSFHKLFVKDQFGKKDYSSLRNGFGWLSAKDVPIIELPWAYDISSWKKYCHFLGSEHGPKVRQPIDNFVKQRWSGEYTLESKAL